MGNVWLDREREKEKERDQLKVILTHHPITPIPPQTFQTSIRSILARIKVFTVAFTVLDEKEIEKKKRVSKRKRRPDVKRSGRERTKNAKRDSLSAPASVVVAANYITWVLTFQIGRSFYSIRSFLRWDLFRRRRGCLLRDLTWCVVSIRVDEYESVMSGGDGWK